MATLPPWLGGWDMQATVDQGEQGVFGDELTLTPRLRRVPYFRHLWRP